MEIFTLLQYQFVQKAFLAGSFVAAACSALGLFLVLRKMSLIGDGLAHTSFGAIALGLFLGIYPYYAAIPVVMAASLLILKISQTTKVYGDAAIGIISVIGIAGGVILASLSKGFNIDLFSYLFGNILAISDAEVYLSVMVSLLVMTAIFFLYWDLFSATFDEEYARTTGIKTNLINNILILLTAVTVVLSVKIVGVMLVSALLILPSVTALQVAKSFRVAIVLGLAAAVASVVVGILASIALDLPAGATIVMVNALFFAISAFAVR